MTREEQVEFCKKCTNRQMDSKQGLLCKLTGEKAAFENECPDFNLDESVSQTPLTLGEDEDTGIAATSLPDDLYQRLLMDQNLPLAIISGLVVGVIGAVLWGMITVATQFQIGYMAVAIGAGVGYGMRHFGKGIEPIFGIAGGAIALLSCLLGNFFSIIGFAAEAEGMSVFELLPYIDYAYIPEIMMETFSPMDLLFYGIAVYEGYKFSFRVIREEDLG